MKSGRIERAVAIILLVIFAGIVVHAPATVWVSAHWSHLALTVKSWKEMLMLVATALMAVSLTRHHAWRRVAHQRVVQLVLAFILLHLVMALVSWHGSQTIAGLMINLRFVLYFLLVFALLIVAPQYRRRFVQVGMAGAALVLGFAALQWLLPRDFLAALGYGPTTIMPYLTIDQNAAFVRLQSTLRGPNPLGIYAMMALSGMTAYALAHWMKMPRSQQLWLSVATVLGLNALIFSQSRSAWLAMGVALIVLIVPFAKRVPRRAWGILALSIVMIGALLATNPALISNVFLHENPADGSTLNSNDGHISSLSQGLARLAVQPFGTGVGSTGSASLLSDHPLIVENYYLYVAHEVGWLGLVIFVWLSAEVIRQAWRRRRDWSALAVAASGAGIAAASMLLPVLTDDAVSIVWWGVAATVIATNDMVRYNIHKKYGRNK